MSWVSYNSEKIIPAPHAAIEKVVSRTEGGSVVGQALRITLNGRFVYGKGGLYSGSGYPADDFTTEALEDLLAKQQAIRDLFADDNKWLEIQPDPEATAPVTRWIAKVDSVEFSTTPVSSNQWTHYEDYTVVLTAQIGNTDDDYDSMSDYDESWELTYNEDPLDTYTLTHNITCTSRDQYLVATSTLKSGWEKAYNYANDELGGTGIDNTIVQGDPGFNLSNSFAGYNYVITKTIDEHSGIYTIQETWLMSDDDTYTTQVTTVERQRDAANGAPDYSVTVAGQVLGFRQTDDTGYADALTEFNDVVEPSLYSTANSAISGVALKTTPTNTSVSYNTIDRTIDYTYTYDNSGTYGTSDQSITVSTSDGDCDKTTITIAGTVQGVKDDTNSAYANATTLWTTVQTSLLSNAEDAYSDFGGTGSLQGPSEQSVGYNEFSGQITYSYTYHDWPTDYTDDQTINTEYDKTRDHYSITVSGTIIAFCIAGYSEAETYFNDSLSESQAYTLANAQYDGAGTLSNKAQSVNVSYNELNRQISYTYTFNDYDTNADVDITYVVNESSTNCGYKAVTLNGKIAGKRSSTRSAWESASYVFNTDYASAAASLVESYISDAQLLSSSKSYNEFNNTITFTYEYLEEDTNYTLYETVTKNYSDADCGNTLYTQTGNVKGFCTGGSSSALTNAETGYATISAPSGANYRMRKSETRNEREGTINYTIEYSSRSVPYDWEETITNKNSITDKGQSTTYNGTVTGFCDQDDNTSRKYNNALTGYTANTPEAPDGYLEVNNSVSHNRRRGVINYTFEYKEKSTCVTGVDTINESITITDDAANDIFAVVPILGGDSTLQDKGGNTPLRRSVTIRLQVATNDDCTLTGKPSVAALLTSVTPDADVVLVEKDTDSWDPWNGSYTRTKTWIYQDCT